jgi:hypothetical protein
MLEKLGKQSNFNHLFQLFQTKFLTWSSTLADRGTSSESIEED